MKTRQKHKNTADTPLRRNSKKHTKRGGAGGQDKKTRTKTKGNAPQENQTENQKYKETNMQRRPKWENRQIAHKTETKAKKARTNKEHTTADRHTHNQTNKQKQRSRKAKKRENRTTEKQKTHKQKTRQTHNHGRSKKKQQEAQ